jgi:DNA-binding SARP family transcriptional activator
MSKLPRHDRGPSRFGDLMRALGATIVLLALLVGMPLALATLIGWPLPHAVPSIDELRETFTGPGFAVPDEAIVKTLAALAWLYWAHLLLCVLVELVAAVRGRVAGGVPLGGINQEMASRLVAAVLVLMPGQGAMGAAAAALPLHAGLERPVAVAAPQVPGPGIRTAFEQDQGGPAARLGGAGEGGAWHGPGGAAVGHGPAAERDAALGGHAAARQATKSYVVRRGDNLWDIAGAHLPRAGAKAAAGGTVECDPFRWKEIYELNKGKRQPGGGRLLDQDLIQPGWVLTMPADAVGLPDDAPPARPPAREARPGGGSGGRDGADPKDGGPGAASPTGTTVAPTTTRPPETTAAPSTSARSAPDRATDPSRPAAEAPPATSRDRAEAERGAPAERRARGWFASLPWITGGGLLAAGVLATLLKLRRVRQRRRPTGWRTPPPTVLEAEAELDMRAAELPELAEFLDLALRAMAAGISRDGLEVPHVLGVIAGNKTLEVILSEPSPGTPAPFETTLSRRRWTLPLATPVAELERLARDVASPLPALVTIGVADQGHVLVNLESFGLVGLAGDLTASRALLNAVAIEFATSSWTDFVEVYMIGFGQELAGLERIRVAASLEEVLPRLEEQARAVSRALDETGRRSLLAGRVDGVASESWTPAVVLCAEPPSPAAQRRLEDLTADPARSPIVAVAIAIGDDAELSGPGWTFTLPADPEDPMRVPPLNLEVEPLRLDDASYAAIVELLRSATGPVAAVTGGHDAVAGRGDAGSGGWVPAEADWAPTEASQLVPRNAAMAMADAAGGAGDGHGAVEGGPAADQAAAGADPTRPAAIEVRVLGRVEVGGVGRIERGKSEELIVFLALHPEGVDSDRIADALWRGVPPAKATLNTTTTVARNSLGATEDGSLRLPHARNGVYRLDPSVGLDWARFQALAARAEGKGAGGSDDLRMALELVRGRPFEGVRPRTYGWALLDLAAVMEAAVVDAADRLAELRLAAGDALGAQWAARAGLRISPYDERLYRRLMLAADLAGNPAGVEAVMEELLKRLDDDSFEPWDALHDETRKLYDRLLGARQPGPPQRRRA